jgi:hypothetical protein
MREIKEKGAVGWTEERWSFGPRRKKGKENVLNIFPGFGI